VYAAPPHTKNEKKQQHRCKLCWIDIDGAEQLRTHNRLEHSGDAHSPVGVG